MKAGRSLPFPRSSKARARSKIGEAELDPSPCPATTGSEDTEAQAFGSALSQLTTEGSRNVIDLTPGIRAKIERLEVTDGIGDGQRAACVMHCAAIADAARRGESLREPTDQLACCCPVLRTVAIALNDAPWWGGAPERREWLLPLVPMLLDSKGVDETTQRRAMRCADVALHDFAHASAREHGFVAMIVRLAGLPRIVNADTAFRVATESEAIAVDAWEAAKSNSIRGAHAFAIATTRAREAAIASLGMLTLGSCGTLAVEAASAGMSGRPTSDRVRARARVVDLFHELVAIQ